MTSLHPDPYRDVDAQPQPAEFVRALEARGRVPSHARLRRRFLLFVPVRPGDRVLEVGCGTGAVLRDAASLVGPRGRVVGVDPSRSLVQAASELAAASPVGRRISVREGRGEQLPFGRPRFDVTLAVTVLLHVADPLQLVKEMTRVTAPRGAIGVQDQDFGTVAVTHPDRELTNRIMDGVAARMYAEPYSGRRLVGLLRAAGLTAVRLRTDVYQDTTLEPWTRNFLERRAERAVHFGIIDAPAAQRWLDGFTALAREGVFVLTMNYYGAAGVKPGAGRTGRR